MSEEMFKAFLKGQNYSPERIKSMCADSTALALQLRARLRGDDIGLEEAEILAAETRKKFAVSISLIESGIAKPEELLD